MWDRGVQWDRSGTPGGTEMRLGPMGPVYLLSHISILACDGPIRPMKDESQLNNTTRKTDNQCRVGIGGPEESDSSGVVGERMKLVGIEV